MKKNTAACILAMLMLTGCSGAGSAVPDGSSVTESGTDHAESAADTVSQKETERTESSAAETTDLLQASSTQAMFDKALDGIRTEITLDRIVQTGTVGAFDYSLTVDLSKWERHTTLKQIVDLSRLFWDCYPKMYARFQDVTDAPTDVILAVENEGYGIAEAGGDFVHLHDMWLHDNLTDYDCITHELAHLIQGSGWDGDYLEYSDYTELFADCCRYEYALDGGDFNDAVWTLQTAEEQPDRSCSVRFLVWLDYKYSHDDTDMLKRFFIPAHSATYPAEEWENAWADIFSGTPLAGMTVDAVWALYAASDFSHLDAHAERGKTSQLLRYYDVRGRFRNTE